MKNFRFLSSLAVAGMLTTGIMTTTLAATDVTTEPVGTFKELSGVQNVVPFVLKNRDDVITLKDLKAYDKFKDSEITVMKEGPITEETALGTGTQFKVGETTYTLVVYGDVDGNGAINILDALAIQDSVANGPSTLTGAQAEAANVVRKDGSGINILDALHIEQYRAPETDIIIDETPVPEEEPPVKETNYKVELKDQYVNNVNESAVEANIVIPDHDNELTTAKKVKLVIVNADGKNGATLKDAAGNEKVYKIPAYTSSVPITFDTKTNKIPEGVTTLRLVSEDGKEVLAEFTIDKHTKEIANLKVTDQKATRDGLSKGTISFSTYGTYNGKTVNAKTLYYKFTTATSLNGVLNVNNASKIDITNNKVENAEVTGLTKANAYNVFYVLEDEYGNRTTNVATTALPQLVTIPTDEEKNKKTVPEVEEVTSPDLDKETDITKAAYTWKLKTHNTDDTVASNIVVSLYKDGKLVATKEVSKTTTKITLNNFKDENKKNVMETEGTYKISVYVKGTENAAASETKWSDEKTVSPLEAVSNVKFTTSLKNEKTLSWESEAYKNTPRAVKGYKIELATYNDSTKEFGDYAAPVDVDSDKFSITNPTLAISAGTMYKARITVVARDDKPLSVVNSNPTESKEFIYTDLLYDSSTADTIKMHVSPAIKFTGKTTKYKVQVWEYNTAEAGGITEGIVGQEPIEEKDITVNSVTGAFEIKGLDNSKTYAFRVVADVDGVEGITNFVGNIDMKKTMPDITKLKVLKPGTEANENEISVLGSGLSINGVDYKNLEEYPDELDTVYNIVNNLSEGDILTYTPEKTTVELGTLSDDRDLTDIDLSKTTLELKGDDHKRTVQTTGAKEIILSAKDGESVARFNTTKIGLATNGRIVANDKVYLTTPNQQDITIGAGAKVDFNTSKVVLTSSQETKVNYNYVSPKVTVTVDPTTEANELTFNSKESIDVVIGGDNSNVQTQNGSITITAKGNVKVSGSKGMNVNSDLTIDATEGNVTIDSAELSGKQNVKVKTAKDTASTVKAKSNTPAPVSLNKFALRKYDYTVTADKTALDKLTTTSGDKYLVPGEDEANATKIKALNDFLSEFLGEDVEGATITATEGKQEVTIVLPKGAETFEVGGLLEGNN